MVHMTGDEFEKSVLRPTLGSALTCRKCGAAFTFEEGGTAAIGAGIHNKVMCPACRSVYAVDVGPSGVTLAADTEAGAPGRPGRRTWWSRLRRSR